MDTWASKKKLTYVLIFCSALFVFVFIPFLILYHKSPTCTDGIKNGSERGIDCGEGCPILCSVDVLSPLILWQRAFKVTSEVYNVVAYIENPNLYASADYAPYLFKIYDSENTLIAERSGVTFISSKSTFAVFEPGIIIGEKIPTRVTFEFISELLWKKDTALKPQLTIRTPVLSEEEEHPRIDALISNNSLQPLSNVEAVVVVFDGEGIAIGASRTFIDYLAKDETAPIIYTWPEPFEADIGFCNVPVDTMLVIDRSGSMNDDQENPPEPLTSVKEAAKIFVDRLEERDYVGLITFATQITTPPDSFLTNDFSGLKNIIDEVFIRTGPGQDTNIAAGLEYAKQELVSSRARNDSSKIIILLTDGIANEPVKSGNPDYPENLALSTATDAKKEGIEFFAVGLGDKVNKEFLLKLASSPEKYYSAASREDVDTIYKDIATALCRKGPAIIEIIPRVYPF